ncbi:MAG TPA: ABC transporter substrate-binding protein [Nitrososphaeraceae archaeon]
MFYSASTSQGGENGNGGTYLDSIRFIQYIDGNVALEEIRSGNLDTYFFRIPLEQESSVYGDKNLKVYEKGGGSFGVLLNPAPSNNSNILNPFQFREIRFAMNYLINRNFVVGEILKGSGNVQIDPFGVSSPEFESILPSVESFGFEHNPNHARKVIDDVLTSTGAIKTGGKWFFHGSPITIRLLIRSDDIARKSMGEMLSFELEKMGFTVYREYGDLNKANTVIYGSDPKDLLWNIYTEAFGGTSAFVRYNPVVTSQMYAPYYGKMPGWQNPSYWNYENETINNITQRIEFSNFTSITEREMLLNQAVKMGIQESVRIFVAQTIDPYVASSSVKGLINDFGAGIPSRISLINAHSATNNDSLDVGVKQIYQGAWNGVGGCSDIYCTYVLSLISDPATFRNPYLGDVIPLRTIWTNVSTVGPINRLAVDSDAIVWNASAQKWLEVGNSSKSKSSATFELIYSNWQNGEPMSKADLLYSLYFPVEWGTVTGLNDSTSDPEYTAQAQVVLPLLKGVKFLNNNHLTSFVDFWHFDDKEIADFASVWSSSPWEIMAAAERLVLDGKYAFSRSDASVKNVDWLSLIIPSHADAISQELKKMKAEEFIPAPLKGFVTKQQAIQRYGASIKWIAQHHHAIIGNGPYVLDYYDPSARVIKLVSFTDKTYPFKEGYWSKYEIPEIASIDEVSPHSIPIVSRLGEPLKFQIKISVEGYPADNASLRYFLSNKNGKLVAVGNGTQTEQPGQYLVYLNENQTRQLSYGPNRLEMFAQGPKALKSDIFRTTIIGLNPLSSLH